MYHQIKRIHLIGIGGIGMSGIAELLLRQGYVLSGSDHGQNDNVRKLQTMGIEVFAGHAPANVHGAELVVYSSAIRFDNPELAAARELAIPIIPRAEMLAELMRTRWGIAVAGAHGKTTTTSLVALALVNGGLDPTIVVGGRMDNFGGTNARLGSGDFMVVEADESDGSFNKLSPCIAVATNMDREHLDHYGNMRKLKKAFASFLDKVPFFGLVVLCWDDPHLKSLSSKLERRKKSYGFSDGANYQLRNYRATTEGSEFEVVTPSEVVSMRLKIPGRHNALNSVAALVVADELQVPRSKSIPALAQFQGVQRRFQKRGEIQGIDFVDDYAHHPSEIRATLAAARERYRDGKVFVVFQPHRYSRVQDLFDEFATCFRDCDEVAIAPIYAAGEAPIAGVDSPTLVAAIQQRGIASASVSTRPIETMQGMLRSAKRGDVVLTLGAGDLPNVYKELF